METTTIHVRKVGMGGGRDVERGRVGWVLSQRVGLKRDGWWVDEKIQG